MLKPLSPLLQPSDLRTIAGPAPRESSAPSDATFGSDSISVTCSRSSAAVSSQEGGGCRPVGVQVAVSQDGDGAVDEGRPSSPSSSVGSHCGFYSFVEDPSSPEAEMNEAWMLSPQRQTQLATLKKEKGFKLQTYTSSKKPESLFADSDGDSEYKVEQRNGNKVIRQQEDQQLRKEIIRCQAPKKNLTFREEPGPLKALSRRTNTLREGLRPVGLRADSGSIDEEQINFSAARQKFLKMETGPPRPPRSSRTHRDVSLQTRPSAEQMETCDSLEVSGKNTTTSTTREEEEMFPEKKRTESLPVEVGGGYTGDDGMFRGDTRQEKRSCESTGDDETPIEREIRFVQEREEKLRRSRGLTLSNSRAEMVEVTTNRLPATLAPVKAKAKKGVNFIIQREIQEEKHKKEEILGRQRLDPRPDRERDQHDEDKTTEEMSHGESGGADVFPPPCGPHQQPNVSRKSSAPPSFSVKGSEVQTTSSPAPTPRLGTTSTTPWSWRENLESNGLHSRGKGAPDFIEKEMEEALRREQELREQREETAPLLEPPDPPANTGTSSSSRFY